MSTPASHIEFSTSPWIAGTYAIQYWGPVRAEVFLPGDPSRQEVHRGYLRLRRKLRQRACLLSAQQATHCVGLEENIDPWAERDGVKGMLMSAVATMAQLAPLAQMPAEERAQRVAVWRGA